MQFQETTKVHADLMHGDTPGAKIRHMEIELFAAQVSTWLRQGYSISVRPATGDEEQEKVAVALDLPA